MEVKLVILAITFLVLAANIISGAEAISTVSFYFNTSINNDSLNISNDALYSSSAMLQLITDRVVDCKYSRTNGLTYDAMENNFDYNLGMLHKTGFTSLSEGINKIYIKCKDNSGNQTSQLETDFNIMLPISAQISLSKTPPINAGEVEITLKTTKSAAETPSLLYSFDGISYNPIPLFGSETNWKGYLIIPETLEESVCSFKFSAKDIEGKIGQEITGNSVFLVDTIPPETISDLTTTGFLGEIDLNWHSEEKTNRFKIYRSTTPNVRYTDYYKAVSTNENSFSDTLVEKGKTYYYRISAIDSADNEGSLSVEVYATALLENTTINPTGLPIELLGLVDNFLAEISSTENTINDIKLNWENKNEQEKSLFSDLKLNSEFDKAVSEITTLKREIESYKSQPLTKAELEKKLNSATLKLNMAKKKVPESITISSEKTNKQSIDIQDIDVLLLSIYPDKQKDEIDTKAKNSLLLSQKYNVTTTTSASNLEINYLDGTRKTLALIKESILSNDENDENVSFFENIPQEIAESSSELNIKNTDYSIEKENTIISFGSGTKEIFYTLDKQIPLDSISKLKTVLISNVWDAPKPNQLTGYFSLLNTSDNIEIKGIFIIALIIAVLCIYFYIIRKNSPKKERIIKIRKEIAESEKNLQEEDLNTAKTIYEKLKREYQKLEENDKKKLYLSLEELHNKISLACLENKLDEAEAYSDKEKLPEKIIEISEIYEKLTEKYRAKIKDRYLALKEKTGD